MEGWGKISHFIALSVNIEKGSIPVWPKLPLMTNRKSYMRVQLAPNSMTLDELERRILLDFAGLRGS